MVDGDIALLPRPQEREQAVRIHLIATAPAGIQIVVQRFVTQCFPAVLAKPAWGESPSGVDAEERFQALAGWRGVVTIVVVG